MNLPTNGSPCPPLLEIQNVTAGYGQVTVLRDVTVKVPPSSVVAILGPNGAGKTTLMRVGSGLVKPTSGRIFFAGEDVTSSSPHALAHRGLCHIPEGRGIFPSLTVRENLVLASPRGKSEREAALQRAIEVMPALGSRLNQVAGSLSGGEQQMLALARAMASNAKLVAVDEASLGLAPVIIERVYEVLQSFVASGAAIILVEQYVNRALDLADTAYLLHKGTVVFSGRADEVNRDDLFADYLGSTVV